MLFAYKAAVEKAKNTDTDAVKVNGGKFEIVGKVAAAAAIGADTCTKF